MDKSFIFCVKKYLQLISSVLNFFLNVLSFFCQCFLFCIKVPHIICGNYFTKRFSAQFNIIQHIFHQIIFLNQMRFLAIPPAFRIIGSTNIIFSFSAGCLTLNRCQTTSTIFTKTNSFQKDWEFLNRSIPPLLPR